MDDLSIALIGPNCPRGQNKIFHHRTPSHQQKLWGFVDLCIWGFVYSCICKFSSLEHWKFLVECWIFILPHPHISISSHQQKLWKFVDLFIRVFANSLPLNIENSLLSVGYSYYLILTSAYHHINKSFGNSWICLFVYLQILFP